MKVYDPLAAACALAKAKRKPVLFLHFPTTWDTSVELADIYQAAPYLTFDDSQALADGYAFIVCDSDKERDKLYELTVGDDGPTMFNKYDGPVRIYALTIDKNGQTLNENT